MKYQNAMQAIRPMTEMPTRYTFRSTNTPMIAAARNMPVHQKAMSVSESKVSRRRFASTTEPRYRPMSSRMSTTSLAGMAAKRIRT